MGANRHLPARSSCPRLLVALALLGPTAASAQLDPDDPASRTTIGPNNPWLYAGATALRAGDAKQAIELTLKGLNGPANKHERAAAHSNLCGAYAMTTDYEQAIEQCTASLALRQTWNAYHNRALAYWRKGDVARCEADVIAGLQINPNAGLLRKVQALINASRLQPRISVEDAPATIDELATPQ